MCSNSFWLFRLLLVFSLLAKHGNAADWDLIVAFEKHIELFYSNKTSIVTTNQRFNDITSIAYDPIYDTVYFSDSTENNCTIYSLNLNENYQNNIVKKIVVMGMVYDMSFDPLTQILYWTDKKSRQVNALVMSDLQTKVIIKKNDVTPFGIALDSCKSVLYWTNYQYKKSSIERLYLNENRSEVILEQDMHLPTDLTIDHVSKKLYWIDSRHGSNYKIETSNLDGSERQELYQGYDHNPNRIFVSDKSVYWTESDGKRLWQLPSNVTTDSQPVLFEEFQDRIKGVIKRFDVLELTKGKPECNNLRDLYKRVMKVNNKINLSNNSVEDGEKLYCLRGGTLSKTLMNIVSGTKKCICMPRYTGDRCEIDICHNYCIKGTCSVTPYGNATCKCSPGYGGERCEKLLLCGSYCKNGGVFKFENETKQITCKCLKGWKGIHCEIPEEVITTTFEPLIADKKKNEVTDYRNDSSLTDNTTINREINYTLTRQEDKKNANVCLIWTNEYIISIYCFVCFLILIIFILSYKVLKIRRQPRIIKRIIGKKTFKSSSKRPIRNGCEITIEDCCNMNKCETPCHESENLYSQLIDI